MPTLMQDFEKVHKHILACRPDGKGLHRRYTDCPLHLSPNDTLTIQPSAVHPGGLLVTCSHPRCNFHGSVLELLAVATGRDLVAASGDFMPGMPLHNTVFKGGAHEISCREVLKYECRRHHTLHDLKKYIDGCKSALLRSSALRHRLDTAGLRERDLEVLPIGTPAAPRHALISKMSGLDACLVLPYTLHGLPTSLKLWDLDDTSPRHTVTIPEAGDASGIFLEQALTRADLPVTVLASELETMQLYIKARHAALAMYPVLPATPSALKAHSPKNITLLATSKTPIPLALAGEYLNCGMSIRAATLPLSVAEMDCKSIRQLIDRAVPLLSWMAVELERVYAQKGPEHVALELENCQLSAPDKAALLTALKHADKPLQDTVRSATGRQSVKAIGSWRIRRSATGYDLLTPEVRRLSNFMFELSYVTEGRQGKLIVGRVKGPELPVGGIEIGLPAQTLDATAGSSISRAIWEQTVETAPAFNPIVGTLRGNITWRMVFCLFDPVMFRKKAALLGTAKNLVVYPYTTVNLSTGVVSASNLPDMLDRATIARYSAIKAQPRPDMALFSALLSNNDPSIMLFMAILLHTAHETVAATRVPELYAPRHLVVPTLGTETDMAFIASQFNCMLSGDYTVPDLSAKKAADILKDDAAAGALPLMYMCFKKSNITAWMPKAPRAYILVSPMTVETHKLLGNTVCAFSPMLRPDKIQRLAPELLQYLATLWPHLLTDIANRFDMLTDELYPPAVKVQRMLALRLGVDAPDMAPLFDTSVWTEEGDLPLFFSTLSRLLREGQVFLHSSTTSNALPGNTCVGGVAIHGIQLKLRTAVAACAKHVTVPCPLRTVFKINALQTKLLQVPGVYQTSSERWFIPTTAWDKLIASSVPEIQAFTLDFQKLA